MSASSQATKVRRVEEQTTSRLAPLQQGMLFHAVGQPHPGVDIEHIEFELHEHLDIERFVSAWTDVTNAHPTMRAKFTWEVLDEPLQEFIETVAVPVAHHQWAGFDAREQERRWRDVVTNDRLRSFDLATPPLQRLNIAELADGHWRGLWSFHHIILDGRSFPLVLRDIFALYDQGIAPPERPSFLGHVDAVNAQDRFGDQVFWKEELLGWEPVRPIKILADHEDAAARRGEVLGQRTVHQQVVETRLDIDTTSMITSAAERLEVSVNTLVQSAWAILLHRYLGTEDIVFGSTRACRHVAPEAEKMVGLLINTVPFRVRLDRSSSVASLASTVAETHRRLRAAETSPLHLVKQWASVEAEADLFESLVMFDDQTLDRRLRDLGEHRSFSYAGQTNLPITLLAYADPEMLVRLETRPDAVGEAPTQRMLDQFITILCSIAEDPDQSIRDVDYLTEHDRALVAGFNDTDVDLGAPTTLDAMLRARAATTPDAPALSFGETLLTYGEYRDHVDTVAGGLAKRGVGAETVVGVLADRSIEMIIAIHGIVAAGGAYLPLDPALPLDRLQFMIDDAAANYVIVAGGADPSALAKSTAAIIDVADLMAGTGADHTDPPADATPAEDDAAYVIYTSGSTGRPKGVVNEHRGIVNRLRWMQNTFELTADDVVVQKTPFTFDVSVWELFWPLIAGARLHIAAPDAHRDPRQLVAEIESSRATVIHFVPSMLSLFLDEPSIDRCSTLRTVICSGEALARDLQDRTLTKLDVELHNLYGPTEAAVDVTWWRCDPSSALDIVPIGAAIANTRMHVLDPEHMPVPPGAQGELFIAGTQVARGYLNRPELSAQRFLEAGALPVDQGRLYRTGDLGRHREDGTIEYLGRTDHQVKVRGLRIELGEIEAVLTSHPAVTNAAVVDRHDRPTGVYLAAYVAVEAGTSLDDLEADLRAHLGTTLADYMVPSAFVVLDDFPLTTSGKIDRKALPAPPRAGDRASQPVGEIEAAVAAIWCDLLGVETVDRTTPFFRAGGHSLLIVRLAHALGTRFDRTVEVTSLIDHATVEAQALLLGAGTDTTDGSKPDADRRLEKVSATAAKRKAASRRRKPGARRPGATR